MTKKSKTIGEPTSALLNKEVKKIDITEPNAEDIYEPDESDIYEPDDSEDISWQYEEQQCLAFAYYAYCQLEYIGIIQNMIECNIQAEKRILTMGKNSLEFLGIDSYEYVMQLISDENQRLKQLVSETREALKITI